MTAPILISLSPAQGAAGSPDILVTITGEGFLPDSVLVWNGADDVMDYVSDTEATTIVRTTMSTVGITCDVEVRNGVDLSNTLQFVITEPAPPEVPVDGSPNTEAVHAEYMSPDPHDVYQGVPIQVPPPQRT